MLHDNAGCTNIAKILQTYCKTYCTPDCVCTLWILHTMPICSVQRVQCVQCKVNSESTLMLPSCGWEWFAKTASSWETTYFVLILNAMHVLKHNVYARRDYACNTHPESQNLYIIFIRSLVLKKRIEIVVISEKGMLLKNHVWTQNQLFSD